jgi:hypothetical protein
LSLLQFARQNGLLASAKEWARRWKEGGEVSGAEHEVIEPEAGRSTYLKRNPAAGQGHYVGGMHNTWTDYFVRLALHRLMFPDTAYRLIGFTQDPQGETLPASKFSIEDWMNNPSGKFVPETKGAPPKLYAVVEQPAIRGTPTTRAQVEEEMKRMGFIRTRDDNYYNPATGVIVEDLHDENVVVRENGKLAIFDPIIYLATPEMFNAGGPLANQPKPARFLTPEDILGDSESRARQRVSKSQPSAPMLLAKFRKAVESLRALGIDPKIVSQSVGELVTQLGKYEEWKNFKGRLTRIVTLALADATNPTVDDFVTLLHETGHAVMARESVKRQAQLVEAIEGLRNSELGLSDDFKESVEAGDDAAAVEQEGRMVQSVAENLAAKGWDPQEAATLMQTIIRMLKNAYHAALLKLAEWRGVKVSPERAMAYLNNRVQMTLAGDFSKSWMSWIGGPRMDYGNQDGPMLHELVTQTRNMKRPAQLRDVYGAMPVLKADKVLRGDGNARHLLEVAARIFATMFGKTVTAADGKPVKIANAGYGSVTEFFTHLTSQNALARINNERKVDLDKTRCR